MKYKIDDIYAVAPGNRFIGCSTPDHHSEFAELVRRANAFDGLVEAAKYAYALIETLKTANAVRGYPREWSIVSNGLRAALADAEAGGGE